MRTLSVPAIAFQSAYLGELPFSFAQSSMLPALVRVVVVCTLINPPNGKSKHKM